MSEVTRILGQIEQGETGAADRLFPLVYEELRRMARARMASERPDHSLQPTALVHEAFLRLVDVEQAQNWDSRGHFFSAAAEAMRRILVESARRKNSQKHGGGRQQLSLEEFELAESRPRDELLALDESLGRLEADQSRAAELVKLRYFAGFTIREAAEILKVSPRKADQIWAYAKSWLLADMTEAGN